MTPVAPASRRPAAAAPAPLMGAVVAAAGVLVLIGWALDLAVLTSEWPGLVTMKANTAIGFVLFGSCLWLDGAGQTVGVGRRNARLARACSLLVGALGAASLAEHAFGWEMGIDQLVFRDASPMPPTSAPGRMAVMTAINFILLSAAFLLLDVETRGRRRPSHWLALVVCANAYLAILGYVYGESVLYAVVATSPIALYTSVLFVVASTGLLVARPTSVLGTNLLSRNLAAQINRRLLPVAILAPPLLGWLTQQGEGLGAYPARFGLAMFTVGIAAIVSGLVWRSSRSLQAVHDQRIAVAQVSAWQQAILDSADLTVIATDVTGTIRSINAEAQRQLGYAAEELLGKTPVMIHVPAEIAARAGELSKELGTAVPPTFEAFVAKARRGIADENDWTYVRRDGSTYPVRLSVTALRDSEGVITGFLGVGADITQRLQTEASLLHLAHHDGLTGVANRTHMREILADTIARSERDGHMLALVFLDLDRFKQINDNFGHFVGDEVLKEFANRLTASVRATDTVARLAGDEFVVILDLLSRPGDAREVAEKIALAMQVPFMIQGHRHRVSASMGVAVRHAGEIDPDGLLRRADAALYKAKQSGRQAYLIDP